jgi:hypothetical protein
MAFSVTTLKNLYLPERSYDILTERGNDDIGQQALDSAQAWVAALYVKAGSTVDLENPTIIEAVYTYSVYWLYSRNKQADIAQEQHKKARILIEGKLGESGAADPDKPRSSGPQAYCLPGDSTPGFEWM